MKAILDLRNGQWVFTHDTDEIQIGFVGNSRNVKFDNLSWGWSIGQNEKSYTDTGIIQSDQPYLSSDAIDEQGEITLEVWADNAGQRHEDEITYVYKSKGDLRVDKWRKTASLSRRRFKIGEALYQVNGTPLVELIEALLAGLTEPTKTVATISYKQSGNFDRLDPFILQFSQALGMSAEETDAFFHYCINEEWS